MPEMTDDHDCVSRAELQVIVDDEDVDVAIERLLVLELIERCPSHPDCFLLAPGMLVITE